MGADSGRQQSSDDGAGGLLSSASSLRGPGPGTNTLMSLPYDVLSAVRHAGLVKDAAVAVGREETRDFLGVGMQALCSSSLNGWI
jgi:hypothetical protein